MSIALRAHRHVLETGQAFATTLVIVTVTASVSRTILSTIALQETAEPNAVQTRTVRRNASELQDISVAYATDTHADAIMRVRTAALEAAAPTLLYDNGCNVLMIHASFVSR